MPSPAAAPAPVGSPRPLRVLAVNQTAATSGAEHSLLTLLAALDPAEARVTVASPVGLLSQRATALGLQHLPIAGTEASFRLNLRTTTPELAALARSAWQVARAARQTGADVVHANTTRAGLIAIAARAFGAPAPLVHVRDWAPPGRAADAVLSVVARGAGAIVANSQYVAEQFGRVGAADRVQVIHNPVDLSRFDPSARDRLSARADLGLPADAPVAGVVGQLTPWKGQDDAIRALAIARESVPSARLVVAGSAKFATAAARYDNAGYAAELAKLPTGLEIDDAVSLLGEVEDVPGVLAALDVLLVPSWEEAFGRVVVEGMAMGLPVIATSNGGPPEIIDDGATGLILDPKDPARWGQALAELLTDAPRRAQIGAAAQR
ncbi:MAG: glycosyltransferase family 4 protein, partial [Solirubrobacteraceae bacterium]|nr:glycosyltransferase family 4 protein [Solirubrobacteraceae bacterium]